MSVPVHLFRNGITTHWHKFTFPVLTALPLRNMSHVWGYLNSFELPSFTRPCGFRSYAYMFGCNLNEIESGDFAHYVSLGEFFYRNLKPGVRPVDISVLVSEAGDFLDTSVPYHRQIGQYSR